MKKFIIIAIIFSPFIFTGCSKVDEVTNNSGSSQSYISEEYGIEIIYPSNWYLYDHKKGNTNLRAKKGSGTFSYLVWYDIVSI